MITDAELVDREKIQELANLPPLEYDRVREIEAERLGVRTGTLDKAVAAKRRSKSGDIQGEALELQEAEPWPKPIEGSELLTELSSAIGSYVFMTEPAANTVALWVLHTYLVDFSPSLRDSASPRPKRVAERRRCSMLSKHAHGDRSLPLAFSRPASFESLNGAVPRC